MTEAWAERRLGIKSGIRRARVGVGVEKVSAAALTKPQSLDKGLRGKMVGVWSRGRWL